MRSSSFISLRCVMVALLALSATACSSTPDRYAFWRNDAPAASTADTATKPNLGDVPASPDVNQARKDMQDLQTKLAADRDSAYQQAQMDKANLTDKPTPSLAAISNTSNTLTPVTATPSTSAPTPQTIQPTTVDNSQPAMANPNRAPDGNPNWPVYVPPSVQINPPLRPYARMEPAPDYAYGRGGAQSRQRLEGSNPVIPPAGMASATPQLGNDNVTVDLSALGGGTSTKPSARALKAAGINGVLTGAPAIYFKHGSTRLSSNDRKTLAALASQAKDQPIQVIGHASSRTNATSRVAAKAINLKVSADRATHVMDELTKKGVNPQQIKTTAVGDRDAKAAGSEASARRVDVLIGQ